MGTGVITEVSLKSMRTNIDGVEETLIVAIEGDLIIGSVRCGGLDRESAYIRDLFVRKNYRLRGVAKQLVVVCTNEAFLSECESIGLQVSGDNRGAIEFYKKVGFLPAYEYDDGSKLMSMQLRDRLQGRGHETDR